MKIPPRERCRLDNGVQLILIPDHEVPLIAFEAMVRGGSRLDSPGQEGLASLTAELLTQGAGPRDAYEFADAVEGTGGSLEADAHREATLLHGQFLAQDRELLLELLGDALQAPHFDAAEIDKLRQRRIEGIRAAKDSEPQSLLESYGRALLFGAHPFGNPRGGSESGLAALKRADVLRLYREHFGADRLTLVFAGDFDVAWMRDAVARRFGSWGAAGSGLPSLAAPQRVSGRRVLLVDSPGSEQCYFWIANVGVARRYPLRAALEVTNTVFGGSFGSMLMQALRVRTGLTYSVSSSFLRGSVAGEFAIQSFASAPSTARALGIALGMLDTLKREGAAAEAIDSARNYILGQYPLGFETAADWAAVLADLDLYGLPESYVEEFVPSLQRVSRADIDEVVASAFPASTDVDIALIADAAQVRAEIAQLGQVIETTLAAPQFYV
ncbi:MAG TPA: pitrilysin family protein [Steroidobacteraceae bacterium]|nr:pitrilysin family protein [Steroidobacteraceae bacterium]